MSELIKSIVVIADGCSKNPIEQSLCKKCQWGAFISCTKCVFNTSPYYTLNSIIPTLNILRNRKQS